ncbi:MAG: MauE/DoxX family redox-associated membrane protein [Pseudonocardiaceae bacterium]
MWWAAARTVLRLLIAAVWLVAGAWKVQDLDAAIVSVRAYELLPSALVMPVGYVLPVVELTMGVLLLVGAFTRPTALFSVAVNVVFIIGIVSAAARGLRIDCGCFSEGGPLASGEPTKYTADLLRDSGFVVATLLLARWPDTLLSVDRRRVRTAAAAAG